MENLVYMYLRRPLKVGPASQAIDGLSQSVNQYEEAITDFALCDPMILDAPSESNGKNLRHLHDVANQPLRALAATKQGIIESFLTSMLEMKLDLATMFEWQRHSQDSKDVPHYSALVDFINLRAQESENTIHVMDPQPSNIHGRKEVLLTDTIVHS